jgi:peptidoglycan/LPS O-acetylase OafA/YrhL
MGRAEKPKGRVATLDGLRGVAALVVLFFHALLYKGEILSSDGGGFGDSIASSPLAFLVSGGSAVVLFFVLSGFVLERSIRERGPTGWTPWIRARLARLYLPIWPVLILYVLYLAATGGDGAAPSALQVLADFTLVLGHGGVLGVLWTLRWEILFSLLIPVLGRIGSRFSIGSVPALAALIFASALGNVLNVGAIQYLPICIAGFSLSRLVADSNGRLGRRIVAVLGSKSARPWLIVVGLLMLGAEMYLLVISGGWASRTDLVLVCGQILAIVGSLMVVATSASMQAAETALSRLVNWLGQISFSLYLVHQPCLELTNRYLSLPTHASIATGIILSIFLAAQYWRFVERPILIWAKRMSTPK